MGYREIWEKWKGDIPPMGMNLAIFVLIICIILPGFGTIAMMIISNSYNKRDFLIVAILQLISTFIIIGWVWSIYWGFIGIQKAS